MGRGGGPDRTFPEASNDPPWHGQTNVEAPSDQARGQPRWVRCGSNAWNEVSLKLTMWTPTIALPVTQESATVRSTWTYFGCPIVKSVRGPTGDHSSDRRVGTIEVDRIRMGCGEV